MKDRISALSALYQWVESHQASPHTHRSYEREFTRLETWLLMEDSGLEAVTTSDLARYLDQFAKGELTPTESNSPKPLSFRTVLHCRSLLWRMFEVVRKAGFRSDNPAESLSMPLSMESGPAQDAREPSTSDWGQVRKDWIRLPMPEPGSRASADRAFTIAELFYWTGVHRSELAIATMGDFEKTGSEWTLAVKRFGSRSIDKIRVPGPAMEAVFRYRVSRGLPAAPNQGEADIPLIADLRSEKPVNAWTIANALKLLIQVSADQSATQEVARLSARNLRKSLIVESLVKQLPAFDLAKHFRSKYAIQRYAEILPTSTLDRTIREMEEVAA